MGRIIERIKAWLQPLNLLIGPFVSVALFIGLVLWCQSGPPLVQLLLPLLMAGGLGGLVQALIANKNKLQGPIFDPVSSTYDLGIAADILIGSASALASLVVGMAVLNRQFFVGPDQAGTSGQTQVTVNKPAPAPTPGAPADVTPAGNPKVRSIDEENSFPSIPTAVRLISFGILTGFAGRRLLPDLSDRIAGQIAGQVKETVAREMKARDEQVRTESEIVQTATAAMTDLARGAPAATRAALAANVAPIQGLAQIVGKYMAITPTTHPDATARVQAKMSVAAEMLAYTLHTHLDTQTVASQASIAVVKLHTKLLASALPNRSWTPVVIVAV